MSNGGDGNARDHLARLHEAERALVDSERRFRTLAEATSQIVWTTDIGGWGLRDSPSWLAFTGVSIQAWQKNSDDNPVHPDDREGVRLAWIAAVAAREPFAAEYRLRRASDGEYVSMSVRGVPVLNDDGSIREWVGACTDISARKEAEAERARLLASEQAARHEAERLYHEAQEARAEAEAASRAKDEFLAMLGHELRNPLAPVLSALQLMRLRGDATCEPERAIIERSLRHMVRLVDDLLDVSRMTRGKAELRRARVELSTIVDRAVEMASPLIDRRRQRLSVSVPLEGLLLDADAERMAQVVSNLLGNAAKYSDLGAAILVVAQRESRPRSTPGDRPEGSHASAHSDGSASDEIVLCVVDNGVGIAPELLPRVFELFAQGERSLERSQGGLGLGLTIVRSLVELHGGRVSIRSEGPGQGCEVEVRLPAASPVERDAEAPGATRDGQDHWQLLSQSPAQSHSQSPSQSHSPSPSQSHSMTLEKVERRVLIVDDNIDAAEVLADLLRSCGHQTRTVHDGPAALAVAAGFLPEVALLDLGLPAMDGYELAARLRAHPGLDGIRLIAITGYGLDRDRMRSRAAGFEHHFVKPVDLDHLLVLLEDVRA